MERPDQDERELAERLEAYAQSRLRPDPAAMLRVRSRVLGEAPPRQVIPLPPRRPRRWRLAIGLLAAAALLVVAVGGASAASTAGGPLYGARLWLESATLPADPAERASAEIARLDARLAEIQAAASSGDRGALDAALAAYRDIVAETLPTDGSADAVGARVQAAVGHHLDVLQSLLGRVPSQATDALEQAIARGDRTLEQLEERQAEHGAPGPSARPTTPPGQASTPPGQASTPPGQASPSGRPTTPPGQASTPPGQASTPPGQASTPPGQH